MRFLRDTHNIAISGSHQKESYVILDTITDIKVTGLYQLLHEKLPIRISTKS
jgi:hypothetical protein